MINRWLEIYSDPRLKALTATMRVAAANGILLAEAEGGTGEPSEPDRWFDVTDMGLMSEEMLRAKLNLDDPFHADEHNDLDADELMVDFSVTFGKVVTPIDQDVPPFYLINGARESIYLLRLRRKEQHDDSWNIAPRSVIVDALRASGDTVLEV